METNQANPQNMIDTTDALEAVSACQSMKNFLFTLILIGLVLCQIVFWMNHVDLITEKGCSASEPPAQTTSPAILSQEQNSPEAKPQANAQKAAHAEAIVFLAATTESDQQTEPVGIDPETMKNIEKVIEQIGEPTDKEEPEAEILLEKETDAVPAETPTEAAGPEMLEPQPLPEEAEAPEDSSQGALSLFRISVPFAAGIVTVCNFIILVAVILYCLSLLMCLKISLAGRLGGINHITRAFFISLFLLVFLTPWQVVLPKVLIGAAWLPAELLCGGWEKAEGSIFWKIMLYLRFCGLPLITVWLLLWAQIRSGKWARASLRRLGMVR
ncbi:MAG: hypothetical protein ABFR90_03025 [Planctomycetota bacterium]